MLGLRLLRSSLLPGCTCRCLSNNAVRRRRNEVFEDEKDRQRARVTRVEKMKVECVGTADDCTLVMNKGLSTPFNCAMHLNEQTCGESVLALVDGQAWDMHRPLVGDAQLSFLHFRHADPHVANLAFWRSCSFILGYVLDRAFKDEHYVQLCSFPYPNVRSGSFVYDVHLPFDWTPSQSELGCLSRVASRLALQDLKLERLDVSAALAQDMFSDNRYKAAAVPAIAAQSPDGATVTLYRLGDHVDISRGPMIASSSLLGRFALTAVHPLEGSGDEKLTRVQGVALPRQLMMTNWTFQFLKQRAANLNRASVPLIAEQSAG